MTKTRMPFPARYMSTVHGNLQQGVPLKSYDGIVSWFVVRVQVARIVAFMQGKLTESDG